MLAFSRKKQLMDALETKIKRALVMSKGQVNSDFDREHPDFVRDAQSKNYTKMIKDITNQHNKHVDNYKTRQIKKFGGKNA